MKRADIVNMIHKDKDLNLSLDKREIHKIVNDTFDMISEYLTTDIKEGKKVMISGFGTFIIKRRKGKVGRNPKTGEEKLIPDRLGISFKAGKELKKKINQK
ncbi:DNA-binding protein HU 1 (DNA-binding protein II) (HB) [Sulfurihydrogenibium azorense Az-Fu1]|jgi:nucleoid DNA-binding protein|uniref:DNA-binding protein HU 1 (DNA-binding protein II) (HB) n=1 Tax=Sulfurihydrogenibium azorense (strain DSM 15241 / OCM 825 / Az-Fu1) TaxID=204536 RepID=C1DT75_SULAA|nr:HU family DNA-binding protein [Sulfurihydrogenibium azorense]ACN98848.1 DNA-binding protein HU 1 (DNA-binding protein II) (HB) [Sulfurihydrogenibium azorense Az-Fu1]MDM7274272.1 HU family DNA-binding protein [Sulfurihydrogenibium azorense]